MNRVKLVILSSIYSLFLSGCTSQKQEHSSFALAPQEAKEFAHNLQQQYKLVSQATEQNMGVDSIQARTKRAHRTLSTLHPISYDWWLQDGQTVDWFGLTTLDSALIQRGKKVHTLAHTSDFEANITNYITACIERRTKRLESFVANNPKIVFTKFHPLRPSFFAYTEGVSDARAECNFIPNSQLAVLHMNTIWGSQEIIMKDSSGVFRDPDVHFDGNHILFAWKKSAKDDDFHLYELNYTSGEIKQLTHGSGLADIEGIYLPDDNIMFNSTRNGSAVDCYTTEVSNLYLCDREGRFIRRIGYDQVHTPHPALLDDGRVVYTRWDYNDRGQVYTQPLFQMNPDGTGQSEFYGMNSFFPTTLTHSAQIPGSSKIMATATGHHSPQHGKLCIVDVEAGRDQEQGVMMVAPHRPSKAVTVDAYGQYGDQFQYPAPLNEKEFLISYSSLGYYVGNPMNFGIYWMNIDGERELLIGDSELSCNQPALLQERQRPFVRASHVDYTKDYGTYYMQDIYAANSLEGVERGTIKKLRIVEIEYRVASVGAAYSEGKGGTAHAFSPVGVGNTAWDLKRVHGTVDVHQDGSALFTAPANTPLYFQALDSNNRVVQTMRSWSTLMPGEMQSCVGCHEHKNSVPLSNHPISAAMNREVQSISPEHSGNRIFSYQNEVQPIWDKHCISCHDGVKNSFSLKGDLRVVDNQTKRKYSESYLSLTHARKTSNWNDSWQGNAEHPEVNWVSSLSEPTLLKPYHAGSNTSNIIRRLEKGHGGTSVSAQEIELVALWIDLLVPFIADYKEANNWTPQELEYYDRYYQKREKFRQEEQIAIEEYITHIKKHS